MAARASAFAVLAPVPQCCPDPGQRRRSREQLRRGPVFRALLERMLDHEE